MTEEQQEQAEAEQVVVEESAPPSEPMTKISGSWTAAIIGLIAVILICCTIVVCSAVAIALFARGSGEASVSGTVTYRERIALPSDAVLQVQVQDVSRADAPADVIGEQVIKNPGQAPIPYDVAYDPNEIKDNHTYSVAARIEDGNGKLLFINTQHYGVITRGNPTENVDIVVEMVAAPPPSSDSGLEDTTWVLANTIPGTQITAMFQAGRLGGSAGCNTYRGTYTTSPGSGGNEAIQFGPLATTMMMCEQPIMDQENRYMAALQATTHFHAEENVLTLFYPGGTLLFKGQTVP